MDQPRRVRPRRVAPAPTNGNGSGNGSGSVSGNGAKPAVADVTPTAEYISDGTWNWLGSLMGVGGGTGKGVTALPHGTDDLSWDFGLEIYEQMMRDPQVAAAVNLLKLGILAQGVRLVNRFPKEDPQHERAQEILEFCNRNLFTPGRLERPFRQTLFELLDAMIFGHKVAEQTYELMEDGVDRGRLCITSIKTKPLHSTQIVVDRFMNVLGLLAWSPRQPEEQDAANTNTGSDGDRNGEERASERPFGEGWRVLPRSKFILYSWKTRDSDPRGTSQIRPAFNGWNIKRQMWPEYLRFLAIYAIPMLLGKVGNSADVPIKNDQGTIIGYKRAINALFEMLQSARNATVMAVNKDDEVTPIEVQGDGEAFTTSIDVVNREITMGILYQVRATNEAEHGSKADSETSQDVLDMVMSDSKEGVEFLVEADVLVPLVTYNYGPEALELLPQVQLSDTPMQDRAKLMGALAGLVKANYFHLPSQVEKLDAEYGFPPRDMEAYLQEIADKRAMGQALLDAGQEEDSDEEDEDEVNQGSDDGEDEDEDEETDDDER